MTLRQYSSTILVKRTGTGCELPKAGLLPSTDILTNPFIFSRIKLYYFWAGFSFSDIEEE
jgi:hypothetical protein